VNVGCIPKKLMHTAALLGESIHDAKAYGWDLGDQASYQHSWEKLRENVQDYIKGLNFGYRVQLREKNVTYLNKLGSFQSAHELVCTDAKGKVEVITAARFVLAVGGRPTPLDCPGAEYAISSDDVFSLAHAPGKTCVVGAGYVALECAGFLAGLNQGEVTVLVRSIPLRGFDRDTIEHVTKSLDNVGVKMILGATPISIQKLPTGKLLVEYSTGVKDEFDTGKKLASHNICSAD
jgi:thioredoxin reductase (NADPH)